MGVYIHKPRNWPDFQWDQKKIAPLLAGCRYRQGLLTGRMSTLDPNLQEEALLELRVLDILSSARLEGENADPGPVRSFVVREMPGHPAVAAKPGVHQMILELTLGYDRALTVDRLSFHPFSRGALVSGEMKHFLKWFNSETELDPVLKAGIAHLWFMIIHPSDKGNHRVAFAVAGMQLCRSEGNPQRWYSLPAQISGERPSYYTALKRAEKDLPAITGWLEWWLTCLDRSLAATEKILSEVLKKARFRARLAAMPFNERQRRMIAELLKGPEGKLTSSRWAVLTDCSQDTALRDIQDLIDQQVLVKEMAGGRSTGYVLASTDPG